MRKAWLAGVALTSALMVSGCVVVVGDDDYKLHFDEKERDGFVHLNRDGDYSRLGGNINLRGRLGGDLSLVSGDVDADGLDVGGDVSIAAGDVNFLGDVAGEVSVAGGDVDWDGEVGGEFSMAAGSLDVDGQVRGEASIAAASMELRANFDDELTAVGDEVRIEGDVAGPVRLVGIDEIRRNGRDDYNGRIEVAGRLMDGGEICAIEVVFDSSARVNGALRVWAEDDPRIANGARIDNLIFENRDGRDCDDLLERRS